MLRNYWKSAWRNIRRQKGYSLLNLFGLAIGMACCLLILLFVQDELSYDRYHKNAGRIYRLWIESEVAGTISNFALAPFAAPPAFAREIPEVESYARIIRIGRRQVIELEERSFEEEGIFLADDTFFDVFSFQFLRGEGPTSLKEPGSVVITRDVALRLFGDEDPLGKVLKFGPVGDLHVTGVIENVPRNSHFTFNYLISFQTLNQEQRRGIEQWLSIQGWAYLLLAPDADPEAVQAKFAGIVETQVGKQAREFGIKIDYFLQKMTDIHLHSHIQGEISPNGNIVYVYVFSSIAIFILGLACINFMNLSTARSAQRAREVGLRKVFGAFQRNLVGQFLAESVLLSTGGLVLSLGLASLALPLFNSFSGKELTVAALFRAPILAGMLALIVFAGLLAGSYPAFFLSGFQPVSVFRGVLIRGGKGSFLRKALVVFQFAVSIALIIGTGSVLHQIDFMKNKDLGFDKRNILVALVQDQETARNFRSVKAELMQNPRVRSVSFSAGVPGRGSELRLMIPEGRDQSETFPMYVLRCDYDFLQTYGMKLAAGRNFSRDFGTDATAAYVVNRTAAKKFGWTADQAVGKALRFAEGRPGTIIGVIEDFHFQPLNRTIEPLTLMLEEEFLAFASIKLDGVDISGAVDFIREKWAGLEPGREFESFFVDDDFAERYSSEEQLSRILTAFALLAVFIACLGLFGLASYTAAQRTREIGIRRVLGSSVNGIVALLSREFMKWVLAANLVAWPTTYLVMKNLWLADFPYRAGLPWTIFLVAGASSLVIALLTVSFQVIRAASADPAVSLRYE